MLEILGCSLFIGSLGVQAVVISGWMRWRQSVENHQHAEEEEVLTQSEVQENATVDHLQLNGAAKKDQLRDPRLVGWEFKIVRANRNLFRDPAILQQLCAQEAESGWILLEKLDDRRVRFKRPMALREMIKSEVLTYDPYRCHYGSAWHPLTWLGAIATLIAMTVPAYLGYTVVSHALSSSHSTQLPATFPPIEPPPRQ